jgi:hypothetical protein
MKRCEQQTNIQSSYPQDKHGTTLQQEEISDYFGVVIIIVHFQCIKITYIDMKHFFFFFKFIFNKTLFRKLLTPYKNILRKHVLFFLRGKVDLLHRKLKNFKRKKRK